MASAVSRARTSGLDTMRSQPCNAPASASAWRRPKSVSGRSARPKSRPAALAAVWPWRARISNSELPHQDSAAVVAVGDLVLGGVADAIDLGGRQREVAARALVAREPGRADP